MTDAEIEGMVGLVESTSRACGMGVARVGQPEDRDEKRAAAARSALVAAFVSLRDERDQARAENDVNHGWVYCPMCGSCGVGGCCGYLCDFCKDHHDKETQDGSPPRDLGDLRLTQAAARARIDAAEAEVVSLRERAAEDSRAVEEAERVANAMGETIALAYEEAGAERGRSTLPSVVRALRERAEAAERHAIEWDGCVAPYRSDMHPDCPPTCYVRVLARAGSAEQEAERLREALHDLLAHVAWVDRVVPRMVDDHGLSLANLTAAVKRARALAGERTGIKEG